MGWVGEQMGKVDCFEIPGVELYFNSLDHFPPHFHAHANGEWEIRVHIRTTTKRTLHYEVVWARRSGPRAPVLREILAKVIAHREELLLEWERKVKP